MVGSAENRESVMRLGIAAALLLLGAQLYAQVVHKCTGKGGDVS
ncbi:hypothetical protein bcgnr5379_63190 [Bacillus cereus]